MSTTSFQNTRENPIYEDESNQAITPFEDESDEVTPPKKLLKKASTSDDQVILPESFTIDPGCNDPTTGAVASWETKQKAESDAGLRELEDKEHQNLIQLEAMTHLKMVNPEGVFKRHWDLLQVFVLAYIALAVPYRIGFDVPVPIWTTYFFVDAFIDLYFIFDIFLNFRTAMRTGDGNLITLPRTVAKLYLTTWFTVDFLSCLPLNYIEYYDASNNPGELEGGKSVNKLARLAKLARGARLLKILRLFRFKKLIDKYEEELYSVGAFRMLKLLLCIFAIAHWLGCAWYFFGTYYAPDPLSDSNETDSKEGWVKLQFGSSHHGHSDSTHGLADRYLASVYFALMTLTTVGYGDIHPRTNAERAYGCVAMLIGGFMFGTIVGSLAETIRKSNPGDSARTKLTGAIHALMYDRKVSQSVALRVRAYFRVLYTETSAIPTSVVFDKLPARERKELAIALDYLPGSTTTRAAATNSTATPWRRRRSPRASAPTGTTSPASSSGSHFRRARRARASRLAFQLSSTVPRRSGTWP